MDPRIEKLWKVPPFLHDPKGTGEMIHWGFTEDMMKWLEKTVKAGWRNIETGAGTTTLALALLGAVHVSIDPARGLFDCIHAYASENGIDMKETLLVSERSEIALPHMLHEGDKHFHLATLDGNRAFPNCFTDFQYMAKILRIGGPILVDDVRDLWQCKLLSAWIKERRPDFQYREFVARAAVFEKVADGNEDFHNQKPFKVSF